MGILDYTAACRHTRPRVRQCELHGRGHSFTPACFALGSSRQVGFPGCVQGFGCTQHTPFNFSHESVTATRMGGASSSLVKSEPSTGQQTIFAALCCTITTCAFGMSPLQCLKSGCTAKSLFICIRVENQTCVGDGAAECVLCQGGVSLVKPPVLTLGTSC
eukprot:scaffold7572_cov55-Phaeocystis_antarctica.AAC.2